MNILHFEYSDFFRIYVKDLIEDMGHTYYATQNGESLYQFLAQTTIDVILTGLELHDMTAEQLIENISKTRYKDIPIIIVTSSEVEDLKSRMKSINYSDFIIKETLNNDTLAKCLERFEPS